MRTASRMVVSRALSLFRLRDGANGARLRNWGQIRRVRTASATDLGRCCCTRGAASIMGSRRALTWATPVRRSSPRHGGPGSRALLYGGTQAAPHGAATTATGAGMGFMARSICGRASQVAWSTSGGRPRWGPSTAAGIPGRAGSLRGFRGIGAMAARSSTSTFCQGTRSRGALSATADAAAGAASTEKETVVDSTTILTTRVIALATVSVTQRGFIAVSFLSSAVRGALRCRAASAAVPSRAAAYRT